MGTLALGTGQGKEPVMSPLIGPGLTLDAWTNRPFLLCPARF